jgi:hypothetical protein
MKKILFLGIFGIILFHGCIEPPDYPVEPVIAFLEMNKTQIVGQTTLEDPNRVVDTLFITFSFTDGDGDLGKSDTDTTRNVFLIDSRLGNAGESFQVKTIPQAGVTNGISGEMTVMLPETFCFPNSAPRDRMTYSIQIVDNAGHYSNIIETPEIELICD